MKFNRLSIQFLFVLALVCASQSMQGMNYLKNVYSYATVCWNNIKPESKGIQSMFIQSTYGLQLLRWLMPEFNEETAQQFIKPCMENIQTLIKSDAGLDFLCELAVHKSIAEKLAKPSMENLQILIKSQSGLNLLCKLAEYIDTAELAAVCVENFQTLIVSNKGLYLLGKLANEGTKVAELLVKACIENLQKLIKSHEGLWLLDKLAAYTNIAELLARPCIENMHVLIKPDNSNLSYGTLLLHRLAAYQHIAALFAETCLRDIQTLIKSDNGLFLLSSLAGYKTIAVLLAKPCIENMQILIKSRRGLVLLGELADHKEVAELLVQPCIENFDYIWQQESCKTLIQRLAKNYHSVKNLIAQKIMEGCGVEYKEGKISPTILHLITHLPLSYLARFANDNELRNILKNVITQEQKLSGDYYTFVHGQRRELYLPEKIYTHLWQLKKKQSLQDFFFAHVKDLVESPEDIIYDKIQKHFILSHGNYDKQPHGPVEARLKLLFMNYALFANSKNTGSNSAYYLLNNHNSPAGRTIGVSPLEPFRIFGYQALCDRKLVQKIETLAQEYENASKYGNLLFIAVPKDKIHKYVYLAWTGGSKQSMYITDKNLIETSDIRVIMDTLLNAPHKTPDTDKLEFCLIMMQHKGGLDPNTGIKVMPILSGDPQKLEELKKKEDALLAEITQRVHDFERRENALARAAVLSKHMNGSAAAQPQSRL